MTDTKKKVIISAICAFTVIAFCLTACTQTAAFDEDWVTGKTKAEIEQRYGAADIYKGEYIEYWTKDVIGYKVARVYFDSDGTAKSVEHDYTNAGEPTHSEDNKVDLPKEIPNDFAIRFSSKYYGEEIYDTYTGTLQKDLVQNGTATARLTPTEETLKEIYAKVLEYRICSVDREMTNDELADKDGLQFGVSPSFDYEIKITLDGNTYIIRGDDTAMGYTDTDADAKNFISFVGFMKKTLRDDPEYKNLPDAVGGYD